jgi:hypothetical protein
MKTIQTEIEIHATPEITWKILMDFDHYPEWNPFIKSIAGEQMVGSQLTAFIQPPGQKGMTFTPIVLKCEAHEEFRWLGKLWGGGFFNGEHYFILNKLGTNSTQFIHGEKFTGILVGLLSGLLKKTKNGFEAMNKALKEKAEGQEYQAKSQ